MTPLLVVLFLITIGVGIVAAAVPLIDAWARDAARRARRSTTTKPLSTPAPSVERPDVFVAPAADPFSHVAVPAPEPRP